MTIIQYICDLNSKMKNTPEKAHALYVVFVMATAMGQTLKVTLFTGEEYMAKAAGSTMGWSNVEDKANLEFNTPEGRIITDFFLVKDIAIV